MSNPDRDARLSNRANEAGNRAGRDEDDRPSSQNRTKIDATRLEMFRQAFKGEKLPRIPDIEGYHVCWLTTTNNADPIFRRLQLGYELIKMSEVPGLDTSAQVKGGEYDGCVGIGEMIAAKLPMELYELYMTEVHHTQPLEEEGKLRSVLEVIEEEALRKKARLDVEEGTRSLGRRTPRPRFEGVARR